MVKIDFHTHTFYSYDCMMQPDRILSIAQKKGLTHIVINDHNTIKGGMACKSLEKKYGIEVIVGSEIKSDIGDVTGIFLKEEILPGPYEEVIRQIKKQNGLAILNHPYVGHQLKDLKFHLFDLIEGYNGRCSEAQNNEAIRLAEKHNKPVIAGSDAHTYAEVGTNYSTFASISDLTLPQQHHYNKTHNVYKVYSQLIKGVKKKDVGLLGNVLLGAPKKIIFNK